jgi:hypothetical protein
MLLDQNAPERVPEQADVTPQAGVGAHARRCGYVAGSGADSEANAGTGAARA